MSDKKPKKRKPSKASMKARAKADKFKMPPAPPKLIPYAVRLDMRVAAYNAKDAIVLARRLLLQEGYDPQTVHANSEEGPESAGGDYAEFRSRLINVNEAARLVACFGNDGPVMYPCTIAYAGEVSDPAFVDEQARRMAENALFRGPMIVYSEENLPRFDAVFYEVNVERRHLACEEDETEDD